MSTMTMKKMGCVIKNKQPVGQCPYCGETLYKGLFPDGTTRQIMCDCELERYSQNEVAKMQNDKSKIIEYNKKHCGFSKRDYQDLKQRYQTTNGNIEAYNLTLQYARNFSKDTSIGFFIYGAPGVGKSLLAKRIMLVVINKGYSAYLSTIGALMDDIKADYSEYKNDTYKKCIDVDLLVIDDLGTEKTSDFDKAKVFSIINERYEQMKPTIYTSNCSLNEIARKYDVFGRVHSRISGTTQVLEIKGMDYRKK